MPLPAVAARAGLPVRLLSFPSAHAGFCHTVSLGTGLENVPEHIPAQLRAMGKQPLTAAAPRDICEHWPRPVPARYGPPCDPHQSRGWLGCELESSALLASGRTMGQSADRLALTPALLA
jgi:hypothetical protein